MLELNVEMTSRWHVGTGEGSPGERGSPAIDAVTYRLGGLPAVPASQLKDVIREHAEAIAPVLGFHPDLVRDVFGGPGGGSAQGRWEWTSAVPSQEPATHVSQHHRRDVERGIVPQDGLFNLEVVDPVALRAVVGPRDGMAVGWEQVALVAVAAATVRRLGKRRNRGLGRCRIATSWNGPIRSGNTPGPVQDQRWGFDEIIDLIPAGGGAA